MYVVYLNHFHLIETSLKSFFLMHISTHATFVVDWTHIPTNKQKDTYRSTFIIASNKMRSVLMRIENKGHCMADSQFSLFQATTHAAKMVRIQNDLILTLLCERRRAELL